MRRVGRYVGGVVVIGLLVGGGYVAVQQGLGPLPDPDRCTATADGYTVEISPEQAENASIIAAVAERRGLPARAISIAIATAFQESKLQNLDSGDRDSLGLFQQRPSQGWGTPKQIMDPFYSANAFYDALVKVDGFEDMPITEAAQRVQRSAFPNAYADHERDGRTIASAMAGYSQAAFTCTTDTPDLSGQDMTSSGLTPRAEVVRRDVEKAFGTMSLGGFAPGGVDSGHMNGSAHYDGRAIDVFFRPISPENTRRGWVLAHYLVANAARLDVAHVIFDGKIWTAGDTSDQGWRVYTPKAAGDVSPATKAILLHRDHVHVDVF
ncbi:MAG TPA: hypothetical protein VH419_07505 [Nocardioidaceae bacterium]|jgi:hypothetical protein